VKLGDSSQSADDSDDEPIVKKIKVDGVISFVSFELEYPNS